MVLPPVIRLAVIGSRGFEDFDLLVKILDSMRLKTQFDTIVSGGARGIDSMAEYYTEVNDIPTEIYPADWEKYGKCWFYKKQNHLG